MEDEKFWEIINFAIDRELEAADFYMELQAKAKFNSSKHFLKDLESMERAHAVILQGFKKEDVVKFTGKAIPDLKISDYLVGVAAGNEMTFQEILILAMKREEASNHLYLDFAVKVQDDSVKNIFLKLASEEAKHKLMIETIYDDEILKEN